MERGQTLLPAVVASGECEWVGHDVELWDMCPDRRDHAWDVRPNHRWVVCRPLNPAGSERRAWSWLRLVGAGKRGMDGIRRAC